jgi:signal peptidase I
VDGHTITVGRLPGVRPAVPFDGETLAAPVSKPPRSPRSRAAARIALNIVFVAMLVSAAVMIGPAAAGFHRYVILTGSMTGTYDRGSIVFDRPVPVSGLKVGDPITYSPPPGFTSQARVTHRIWSIQRGVSGARVFKTKGDANKRPDIWTFTLNQPMQDEVAFHVPKVGYLFLLLSLRDFRIALVGLPALIIGLILLRQLWRDGGDEARRQRLARQGWQLLIDPGYTAVLAPIDVPAAEQFPAWLDLRLRPRRPSPTGRRARQPRAQRPCIDVRRPLRVGRLTSAQLGRRPAEGERSPAAQDRPASGVTLSRLRVTRLM